MCKSATFETGSLARLRWVLVSNLHRRHLTESQRAMVAAKLADLPAHRPSDKSANLPTSKTQTQAAEMLNVADRTVRTAKQVIKNAIPELRDMVDQGEVSVNAASQVSKLPEPEQRKAIFMFRRDAEPRPLTAILIPSNRRETPKHGAFTSRAGWR